MKIESKIQKISPAMAERFLKTNHNNRRVNQMHVKALASAMQREEWIVNHQGIAFDQAGRLIDGQHRLKAIILSQKTVPIMVSKYCDPNSYLVLDIGKKRSFSDTTGLSKRAAEECRFLASLIWNDINVFSSQQILEIAECGVNAISEELQTLSITNRRLYTSTAIRSALITLILDGFDKSQMFEVYLNLVYQKFENLPPLLNAFIRSVNLGNITSATTMPLYIRGLKLFNPNNWKLGKFMLKDDEHQKLLEYARSVLNKNLEKLNG
jgi:hypothetical protein